MNNWQKYSIGNALRGTIYFKARTLKEAWKIGCKRVNKIWPSSKGRWVTLAYYDNTPILTTRWVIKESKLPEKERKFSNHELPVRGYIDVASGISKEKLIRV